MNPGETGPILPVRGKLFDTENLLNPFQRLQQKTLRNRVGGRYPDQFNVLPVPEDFLHIGIADTAGQDRFGRRKIPPFDRVETIGGIFLADFRDSAFRSSYVVAANDRRGKMTQRLESF